MAKFLQNLLGATEPLFGMALHDLERASGHSGVDVRLVAEILEKAHDVMRQIGLDPADTTAVELYKALGSHSDNEELFKDTDYVGLMSGGKAISFNHRDVQANRTAEFDLRSNHHMQKRLQQEIVERYNDHDRTDPQAVEHFAKSAGLDKEYAEEDPNLQQVSAQPPAGKPYILSIGDIVTDAFIKLREDQATVYTDENGTKRLSMEFGSKPPYDHVDIVQAVGNSANASVSFARLGLGTGLMAWLGDDQPGKDSLAYLAGENVDTTAVSVGRDMKSNYHFALRYGADRTILIKYEDYDYKWQQPAETPEWIYLSMVSKSAWQLHVDLVEYLAKHPDVKLAFQPGTFHFEWGTEKLAEVYAHSYIVFMNREEAALVTGESLKSIPDLVKALHNLGPKIVVVTDGPDGAYASDGEKIIKMPNYPDPAPPYDRTGAGDAFASTIVAALALDESLETALRWAPVNSMSVVQKLGAQEGLLRKEEIDKYLESAPEEYAAEELQ